MTEERKREIQEAQEYVASLDEATRNERVGAFAKKRKKTIVAMLVASSLMTVAAGVLTGVTLKLDALQGMTERVVIAGITIAIGTVLLLCVVMESVLLAKIYGKNGSQEEIVKDYVATNCDALYKESLRKKAGE